MTTALALAFLPLVHAVEVQSIARLSGVAQVQSLRLLLEGEPDDKEQVQAEVFVHKSSLVPALVQLRQERGEVGERARRLFTCSPPIGYFEALSGGDGTPVEGVFSALPGPAYERHWAARIRFYKRPASERPRPKPSRYKMAAQRNSPRVSPRSSAVKPDPLPSTVSPAPARWFLFASPAAARSSRLSSRRPAVGMCWRFPRRTEAAEIGGLRLEGHSADEKD